MGWSGDYALPLIWPAHRFPIPLAQVSNRTGCRKRTGRESATYHQGPHADHQPPFSSCFLHFPHLIKSKPVKTRVRKPENMQCAHLQAKSSRRYFRALQFIKPDRCIPACRYRSLGFDLAFEMEDRSSRWGIGHSKLLSLDFALAVCQLKLHQQQRGMVLS